jgi:hypothetical protein
MVVDPALFTELEVLRTLLPHTVEASPVLDSMVFFPALNTEDLVMSPGVCTSTTEDFEPTFGVQLLEVHDLSVGHP